MDYKYIEQLLERYWRCETSLEEECILRTFFSQKDIPAELSRFRPLFVYEQTAKAEDKLGDDFDDKILSMIGETPDASDEDAPRIKNPKMRMLTMRLMPLFKAAAVVAIIVTLGNAAQLSMGGDNGDEDINYSSYKDTYSDPSVAYDKVENALQLVSEGISQSQTVDSLKTMPASTVGQDATTNKE